MGTEAGVVVEERKQSRVRSVVMFSIVCIGTIVATPVVRRLLDVDTFDAKRLVFAGVAAFVVANVALFLANVLKALFAMGGGKLEPRTIQVFQLFAIGALGFTLGGAILLLAQRYNLGM